MKRIALVIVLIVSLSASEAFGQRKKGDISTPIAPLLEKFDSWLGPVIGMNWNIQKGMFLSACDCPFTEGAGFSGVLGVEFEREVASYLTVGARLSLESRSLNARFIENEEIMLQSPTSEEVFPTVIGFRNTAELGLGAVALAPFVRFKPTKWLFLHFSAVPTFITGSTIRHDKEILQRRITLANGEIADVRFQDNGRLDLNLEDGEYDSQSFLFSAGIGVGLNLELGERVRLLPMYQYMIPFSEVSQRGENFMIASSQFTVSLLFRLAKY